MNLVYTCGVWDMLHVGHINILKRAKSLGGILIVGVCPDEVVKEEKGEKPIYSLEERITLLESLKFVDLAIPYDKENFVLNLKRMNIDVLVVGEYWGFRERHLAASQYMKENNKKVIQFPYTKTISSTSIKDKLLEVRSK